MKRSTFFLCCIVTLCVTSRLIFATLPTIQEDIEKEQKKIDKFVDTLTQLKAYDEYEDLVREIQHRITVNEISMNDLMNNNPSEEDAKSVADKIEAFRQSILSSDELLQSVVLEGTIRFQSLDKLMRGESRSTFKAKMNNFLNIATTNILHMKRRAEEEKEAARTGIDIPSWKRIPLVSGTHAKNVFESFSNDQKKQTQDDVRQDDEEIKMLKATTMPYHSAIRDQATETAATGDEVRGVDKSDNNVSDTNRSTQTIGLVVGLSGLLLLGIAIGLYTMYIRAQRVEQANLTSDLNCEILKNAV